VKVRYLTFPRTLTTTLRSRSWCCSRWKTTQFRLLFAASRNNTRKTSKASYFWCPQLFLFYSMDITAKVLHKSSWNFHNRWPVALRSPGGSTLQWGTGWGRGLLWLTSLAYWNYDWYCGCHSSLVKAVDCHPCDLSLISAVVSYWWYEEGHLVKGLSVLHLTGGHAWALEWAVHNK